MSRKYDIVLLGATGFTGKICCEYLAGRINDFSPPLRWALAGRSKEKLITVRDACAKIHNSCGKLDILQCNSLSRESLDKVVMSARVVATTVGPYAKYGDALVDSCAANGTHYVDITGESLWIHGNINRAHKIAVKSGAKIVHCCGFDSIPSDLGALMMVHEMRRKGKIVGDVRYISGISKGAASGGTLATMLNMMDTNTPAQMKKLSDPYLLGGEGKDKGDQRWARYEPHLNAWTAPFVMAGINTRIVRRSASLLNSSPPSYLQPPHPYLQRYNESMLTGRGLKGRIGAMVASIGMPLAMILLYFKVTRWLIWRLLKLPNPGEGPSKKTQETGYFITHLVAESADIEKKEILHGIVAGSKDPGYGQTAIMLVESALCLAFDQEKLERKEGGILTPASAMGLVLIDRLRKAGMVFRCLETAPNFRTILNQILPGKKRKKKKRRSRLFFILFVLLVAIFWKYK